MYILFNYSFNYSFNLICVLISSLLVNIYITTQENYIWYGAVSRPAGLQTQGNIMYFKVQIASINEVAEIR